MTPTIQLMYLPWKSFIAFHGLEEFGAEGRFEGQYFTWTIGKGV